MHIYISVYTSLKIIYRKQLKMGFQRVSHKSQSHGIRRYERLGGVEEKVTNSRKCYGRFKGLRLSHSRKLNWKAFSEVSLPRKIARLYGEIVKRMKMEEICPAIVFSCQWGLPVLSHSTVKCF